MPTEPAASACHLGAQALGLDPAPVRLGEDEEARGGLRLPGEAPSGGGEGRFVEVFERRDLKAASQRALDCFAARARVREEGCHGVGGLRGGNQLEPRRGDHAERAFRAN